MLTSRRPDASRGRQRGFTIMPFARYDDLAPIVAAWARSFAEPPNGPRLAADLEAQVIRHMQSPDFAGFVARALTSEHGPQFGDVLGMIYGYSNQPGEWWRERVAMAMTPDQVTEILNHSYCLSELGVVPEARRMGIAEALVATLVAHQPHPYILLSTRSDNRSGKAFYAATGWQILLPSMSFGWNYPPYDILLRTTDQSQIPLKGRV